MQSRLRKLAIIVLLLIGLGALAVLVALKARPTVDTDSDRVRYQPDTSAKPGLRAVFYGTSTLSLTDGTNAILIDGFFSRPSFLRLLTQVSPDADEIAFALSKAPEKFDAIFVAHSHHDHAMDAGLVAIKTGAVVHGSESTLNVARGQGTPTSQLQRLQVRTPLQFGAFRVTAYETPHSPEPTSPGFITEPVHTPAKLSAYRVAENFSFHVEHPLGKVLIVPSANYTPGTFNDLKADVVVLGIGTLGKQPADFAETYWGETVKKTGAKLVFPVHWDDFTRSLREPLVPMPYFLDDMKAGLAKVDEMARRDGVTVRFLLPLQNVVLPASP
jgi:L-ascorbate metabolism protein UlaG (beta-lactamase superfamily)